MLNIAIEINNMYCTKYITKYRFHITGKYHTNMHFELFASFNSLCVEDIDYSRYICMIPLIRSAIFPTLLCLFFICTESHIASWSRLISNKDLLIITKHCSQKLQSISGNIFSFLHSPALGFIYYTKTS